MRALIFEIIAGLLAVAAAYFFAFGRQETQSRRVLALTIVLSVLLALGDTYLWAHTGRSFSESAGCWVWPNEKSCLERGDSTELSQAPAEPSPASNRQEANSGVEGGVSPPIDQPMSSPPAKAPPRNASIEQGDRRSGAVVEPEARVSAPPRLPPPAVIAGKATFLSPSTIAIDGLSLTLAGVRETPQSRNVTALNRLVAAQTVRCEMARSGYRCATADGIDLGNVVIQNGLALDGGGYEAAEQAARRANLGVWE